jgi:hypothetical protein
MSSTTKSNSTTISDQNSSSKKSKKKSIPNLHSESEQRSNNNAGSNKHLNNITNSSSNSSIKTVATSKIDKKKASLENLLIDQAIKSNQQSYHKSADRSGGTFLTEAMLNASLLRGANSKSDLILKNAENNNNSNESAASKKQNKKQRSKVQVSSNTSKDKTSLQMNDGTNINKSFSTPVINNNNSSSIKKASTSPAINPNSTAKSKKDPAKYSHESNNVNEKASNKATADIRDRYWAYLFENLKRSVDEIFHTCENDNSISECKEVISILENCTNEFHSLAAKINEYEKAHLTNKRPTSLAWELSKSSPPPPTSSSKSSKSHPLLQALIDSNEKKMSAAVNRKLEQMKMFSGISAAEGFKDFLPEYANVSNHSSSETNNISNDDYLDDDDDDLDYDAK